MRDSTKQEAPDFSRGEDVTENHHKIDGKYVVERCGECGHVKRVRFIKYKSKGRPAGSKNKPKESKRIKTLGDY